MAFIKTEDLILGEGDYAQRTKLPYEAKVELAERRIKQFHEILAEMDRTMYVSNSEGKDSRVISFMTEKLFPGTPNVFCNTGMEFPEMVKMAKEDGCIIIRPEKKVNGKNIPISYYDIIQEYGYPIPYKECALRIEKINRGNLSERYRNKLMFGDERGKNYKIPECWKILLKENGCPFKVSSQCCVKMKEQPFKKFERENKCSPILGITQDEGMTRKRQYQHKGCIVTDSKGRIQCRPLGAWNEQDVLRYIAENNIKLSPLYGEVVQDLTGRYYTTGLSRTGCIFCGFGAYNDEYPSRFQQLEKSHPQLYDYCMREPVIDNNGKVIKRGLGMAKVFDYINENSKEKINYKN